MYLRKISQSIAYSVCRFSTAYGFFVLFYVMSNSYGTSFYHNVIKAQWQLSPSVQLKNLLKNELISVKKI